MHDTRIVPTTQQVQTRTEAGMHFDKTSSTQDGSYAHSNTMKALPSRAHLFARALLADGRLLHTALGAPATIAMPDCKPLATPLTAGQLLHLLTSLTAYVYAYCTADVQLLLQVLQ